MRWSAPITDVTLKRLILEIGTGNDLYGEDYTKAALRAVQDAIHHSSIILFRTLDLDHALMQVEVTIAVEKPEAVALVSPVGPKGLPVTMNSAMVVTPKRVQALHFPCGITDFI